MREIAHAERLAEDGGVSEKRAVSVSAGKIERIDLFMEVEERPGTSFLQW